MANDIPVLQVLRIKGRAAPEVLASATGHSEGDVRASLAALIEDGSVEETNIGFKLTAPGREAADALLASERASLDAAALAAVYEDFTTLNDDFKALVTSWQMKSETEFNDHSDAVYDRAVIDRLVDLHARFAPVAARAGELVPRLASYAPRFEHAINEVTAGNTDYVAKPLIDSYHTVWFELHEELIQALGRDRAAEGAF